METIISKNLLLSDIETTFLEDTIRHCLFYYMSLKYQNNESIVFKPLQDTGFMLFLEERIRLALIQRKISTHPYLSDIRDNDINKKLTEIMREIKTNPLVKQFLEEWKSIYDKRIPKHTPKKERNK